MRTRATVSKNLVLHDVQTSCSTRFLDRPRIRTRSNAVNSCREWSTAVDGRSTPSTPSRASVRTLLKTGRCETEQRTTNYEVMKYGRSVAHRVVHRRGRVRLTGALVNPRIIAITTARRPAIPGGAAINRPTTHAADQWQRITAKPTSSSGVRPPEIDSFTLHSDR